MLPDLQETRRCWCVCARMSNATHHGRRRRCCHRVPSHRLNVLYFSCVHRNASQCHPAPPPSTPPPPVAITVVHCCSSLTHLCHPHHPSQKTHTHTRCITSARSASDQTSCVAAAQDVADARREMHTRTFCKWPALCWVTLRGERVDLGGGGFGLCVCVL